MKYILIILECSIGGYEFFQYYTTTTKCNDICFAGQRLASKFWGDDGERIEDGWDFHCGEVNVKLYKVSELTKYEFEMFEKITL